MTHRHDNYESFEGRSLLCLLGCWSLHDGYRRMHFSGREQRVIAYLALRGRRRRIDVAAMLWPQTSEDRALGSLRSALSRIRRGSQTVLIDADSTSLALSDALTVDVHMLAETAEQLIRDHASVDAVSVTRRLGAAELLPGWYDDWVLEERDTLDHLRLTALETLAQHQLDAREGDFGLSAARTAISVDWTRESCHTIVINAHILSGNPAGAVVDYQRLAERLRTDLGLSPSRALSDLVQPYLRHQVPAMRAVQRTDTAMTPAARHAG